MYFWKWILLRNKKLLKLEKQKQNFTGKKYQNKKQDKNVTYFNIKTDFVQLADLVLIK